MKRSQQLLWASLALCLPLVIATVAQAQQPPKPKPKVSAGSVLKSMFDITRSQRVKAKSLMQRNFLESVGTREQALQVAFVIDGTDSMGTDIQGVLDSLKSMIGDLQRNKSDAAKISFNLVIYRDVESPSGVVATPLGKKFTSSMEELETALKEVKTESGAPYFEEAVDQGLYEAFTALEWTPGDETVHWVIAFGDAPPYQEGFADPKTMAKRAYSNEELEKAAKDAKITVHSVLCGSGYADPTNEGMVKLRATYTKSLDANRKFGENITTKTGGTFLDLSNGNVVDAIVAEAKRVSTGYQAMEVITPADVEAALKATTTTDGEVEVARVAVLPHLAWAEMKFDAELPAVQVATLLREKLRQLPNIEVKEVADVRIAAEDVQKLKLDDAESLQKLAADLRVDYVVWGSYVVTKEQVQLKSSLYRRVDGTALVDAESVTSAKESVAQKDELAQNNLTQTVADKLLQNAATKLQESKVNDGLAQASAKLDKSPALAKQFAAPLSNNLRASREMLAGLDLLEQAVALPKGDPAALGYLDKAKVKFGAAALIDDKNPLIYSFLATAHYNAATADPNDENIAAYTTALEQAKANLANTSSENYRQLIDAQYALVILKDPATAIKTYEALVAANKEQIDTPLKARWMLAGIYAGDWNVPAEQKDPAKAREQIVQILAHWPNSKEADYLKAALRWDSEGGTQHPHLPLVNTPLVMTTKTP